MKLINILESMIFEASAEDLRKNFVNTGKEFSLTDEEYDMVVNASNNQYGYASWLVGRIKDKIILLEDLKNYKDYFKVFDKYKNKYPFNDISKYKTREQISDFISKSISILDMNVSATSDGENLVTTTDMMKLKNIGIKLIGMIDGYQCFKIPKELNNDENAWNIYKKILGDAGGKTIAICTIANFSHFKNHLEEDDFYVFFNKKDDKSPYQFGYAQKEFKDRENYEYLY